MKTEQEIRDRLEQIEADDRLPSKPADSYARAHRTMIQVDLEARSTQLHWVLGDNDEQHPHDPNRKESNDRK